MRNVECEKCKENIKNLRADNMGRVLFGEASFVYIDKKYYHIDCQPKVEELQSVIDSLKKQINKLKKQRKKA